ncbi:MAG TPA: hypothetical protein VGS11_12490 [Candidatus Bathyarchaeia archaeon]|nr:hypothetical protein [Candidatus Bathyarchaeia archaeon]
MSYNNVFVDRLSARLSNDGYSIQRAIKFATYDLDLLATKVELSVLKGNRIHVIVATTMEVPNSDEISSFSESAYQYVTGNLSGLVQAAVQKPVKGKLNLYVIPVTVSNDFSEDIKKWISSNIPAKHFVPFNYPILISSNNGQVFMCKKTPVLGALAWKGLMKFVEKQLSPQS